MNSTSTSKSEKAFQKTTQFLFSTEVVFYIYVAIFLFILFKIYWASWKKQTFYLITTAAVAFGALSSFLSRKAITSDLLSKSAGFIWYHCLLADSTILTVVFFYAVIQNYRGGGFVGLFAEFLMFPLLFVSIAGFLNYGNYSGIVNAGLGLQRVSQEDEGGAGRKVDLLL